MSLGPEYKGTIGILTGGGDVPGLNPAIRGVTVRAHREGYKVIGIRRGWGGLIDVIREKEADNSDNFQVLTEDVVNRAARTGGTFLHTSRTNPSKTSFEDVPEHLRDIYNNPKNDLTEEVLKNLEFMGIDYLVPIGGDDTLSYGVRLHKEGFKVNAIPKTMDNDVPGTDLCIGFSTCITRTKELINRLRTSAGSHERFLVAEVFGRYAGFTAFEPTMGGDADRCVIPEVQVPFERLAELLSQDRIDRPSRYSVVIVSEGATFGDEGMMVKGDATDAYGHRKLGGIGDYVSARLEEMSPQYNNGKKVGTINQNLGYLVRSGDPDFLDSKMPIIFGNIVLDLIGQNTFGRLVAVRNGRFDEMPIEVVTSTKKLVDVDRDYDVARLHPIFKNYLGRSLF